MDEKNYDKDACYNQFMNFKNCKKFWTDIIKQRRRDQILPEIPPPEEREEILKAKLGK